MLAHLGTLNYLSTSELAPTLASGTATAIALLLFLGAMGKSAQMPLHVWLPDAMEGPTPVSALIHAATMVTAGVFLLVRSHGFLEVSGDAGTIVAWVGGLTAFFAATVALTQYDIKRVLAYSTISQLGYLFLAVGVGAYVAAIFHMVTHAFFKALLFLGSGSVIHGMHDEQDMRYMGALRKVMPITAATFIVGWLAIAGVFPLSGFWSKDEILASAWFGDQPILWGLGIVTAILTAFYMTRQVVMVFFSPARWDNEDDLSRVATEIADEKGVQTAQLADDVEPDAEEPEAGKVPAPAHLAGKHPHESPRLMTVPLIVLAVLSFFGGILNLPFPGFHQLGHWLEPVIEPVVEGFQEPHPDSFNAGLMFALIALGGAVAGIALGWSTYKKYRGTDDPTIGRLGPLAAFLSNAWYFDAFYQKVIAEPGRKLALFLSRDVDSKLIDGLVNGVGKAFGFASVESGKAETGYVRQYALVLLAGTVVLITYAIVRAA
jgi:NADH-quinone oxidoreductase subunit L